MPQHRYLPTRTSIFLQDNKGSFDTDPFISDENYTHMNLHHATIGTKPAQIVPTSIETTKNGRLSDQLPLNVYHIYDVIVQYFDNHNVTIALV